MANRTWVTSLLLTIGFSSPLQAGEKLSKDEIIRQGRSATAIIEGKAGSGRRVAFCIHPDGIFLTYRPLGLARHGDPEMLILNPGESNQKVFRAKLIRTDRLMDLALIRVEGKDFPFLKFGSVKELAKDAELISLGIPSKRSTSAGTPPVTPITPAGFTVAALQGEFEPSPNFRLRTPAKAPKPAANEKEEKKKGELYRIWSTKILDRGEIGGPLLDSRGRVVGIGVEAKSSSSTPHASAIPANQIATFLAKPELAWEPPHITADNMHQPALFRVRVFVLMSDGKHPTVELVLRTGQSTRRVPMKLDKGAYQATEVPVPKSHETGPKSTAPPEAVTCSILVQQDGKEIGRLDQVLPIRRKRNWVPAAPKLSQDKVVHELEGAVSDLAVGGGGRYILLKMPVVRKVAIFDVTENRVKVTIPLPEIGAQIAAGWDKFIFYLPDSQAIERWDLKTCQQEMVVRSPFSGSVSSMALGCASQGPLLAHGEVPPPPPPRDKGERRVGPIRRLQFLVRVSQILRDADG